MPNILLSLPDELLDQILCLLSLDTQTVLRLVSRSLASFLTPRVFEALVFNSRPSSLSLIKALSTGTTRVYKHTKKLRLDLVFPRNLLNRSSKLDKAERKVQDHVLKHLPKALCWLRSIRTLHWTVPNNELAGSPFYLNTLVITWLQSCKDLAQLSIILPPKAETIGLQFDRLDLGDSLHHLSISVREAERFRAIIKTSQGFISRCPNLEKLGIYIRTGQFDFRQYFESLPKLERLKELHFNFLYDSVTTLPFGSTLKTLGLSRLPKSLAPLLVSNEIRLEALHLEAVDQHLVDYLNSYSSLKTLSLGVPYGIFLTDQVAKELYESLVKHADTLEELCFIFASISAVSLPHPYEYHLAKCYNLERLTIGLQYVNYFTAVEKYVGDLLQILSELPRLVYFRIEDRERSPVDVPDQTRFFRIRGAILCFDRQVALRSFSPDLVIEAQVFDGGKACFVLRGQTLERWFTQVETDDDVPTYRSLVGPLVEAPRRKWWSGLRNWVKG